MEGAARPDQRHARNADGEWFVDRRCIDCDTWCELAPDVFVDIGTQSVVGCQPDDAERVRQAWLAAVACSTQSIGTGPHRR
ncbi:MAG: ferredoxin, partial [Acidimicrobiales bacterium]